MMVKPTPRYQVWLELGGKRVIGADEAKILEGIQKLGSFMAASKAVGVSYAHAWNAVDGIRRALGKPVVEARKGGEFGGGARLTEDGVEILRQYRELEGRVRQAVLGDVSGVERGLFTSSRIRLPEFTIIGSDCIGLNILVELMLREKSFNYEVVRVGSSGGLSAIMLGEADIAGIHLLDEETKEYNLPFLKRYWVADRAALIRGYVRDLGLIVARGNPKGIRSVHDLLRGDVKIVNRNLGSGTRALLDMLLKKEAEKTGLRFNVALKKIRGYSVEVNSHARVADAVAKRVADAGFGIKYVADARGLDFIPLIQEHFDFVVEESRLRKPLIKLFINKLSSKEFREKAEEVGLHVLEDTGRIVYRP